MEKLLKHLIEQPEPLEKVRPDVPPELAAIVRRLMDKDPAQRYQTPAELVRELEEQRAGSVSNGRAGSVSDGHSVADASGSSLPAQTEHTRILDGIDVFAPSQAKGEPSGPSLLEPLWKHDPDDQRWPDTHDMLALSRPEGHAGTDRRDADPTSPTETLPPIDGDVFHLWRRWLGLVETIVAGRGPSHVNGETYQTIHTLLLQSCRAAIDACPVPERRAFYEECLSITQPWLKLQTFVHIDTDMLDSLLERCRQIEVELNDGKAPWTIRKVLGLVLLALSPLGAALWYWSYGRVWLPSLLRAFDDDFSVSSLGRAWNFLLTHPTLLMGVVFPLVIIFSIVLLSRTKRT